MQDRQRKLTLFIHLIEGETPEARLRAIRGMAGRQGDKAVVFAALAPDSPYAPTDWLMGPGCNCCLAAGHPRARLLALGLAPDGCRRVLIDAGRPVLADRLARVLRAMPFPARVNIITV